MLRKRYWFLVIFLVAVSTVLHSQTPMVSCLIGAGANIPASQYGDCWNTGYGLNGEIFVQTFSNFLQVGERFSYNRWDMNIDKIASKMFNESSTEGAGYMRIQEFMTDIRYTPFQGEKQIHPFLQLGFGYYTLKYETRALTPYGVKAGTYDFLDEKGSEFKKALTPPDTQKNGYSIAKDGDDSAAGMCAGLGVIMKGNERTNISLYPLYTIIFTKDGSTQYLTINLAVEFGLY